MPAAPAVVVPRCWTWSTIRALPWSMRLAGAAKPNARHRAKGGRSAGAVLDTEPCFPTGVPMISNACYRFWRRPGRPRS